jgi:hypothetical protein
MATELRAGSRFPWSNQDLAPPLPKLAPLLVAMVKFEPGNLMPCRDRTASRELRRYRINAVVADRHVGTGSADRRQVGRHTVLLQEGASPDRTSPAEKRRLVAFDAADCAAAEASQDVAVRETRCRRLERLVMECNEHTRRLSRRAACSASMARLYARLLRSARRKSAGWCRPLTAACQASVIAPYS